MTGDDAEHPLVAAARAYAEAWRETPEGRAAHAAREARRRTRILLDEVLVPVLHSGLLTDPTLDPSAVVCAAIARAEPDPDAADQLWQLCQALDPDEVDAAVRARTPWPPDRLAVFRLEVIQSIRAYEEREAEARAAAEAADRRRMIELQEQLLARQAGPEPEPAAGPTIRSEVDRLYRELYGGQCPVNMTLTDVSRRIQKQMRAEGVVKPKSLDYIRRVIDLK